MTLRGRVGETKLFPVMMRTPVTQVDSEREMTVPVSLESLGGLWHRRLGFRGDLDSVRSDRTTWGVVLALRIPALKVPKRRWVIRTCYPRSTVAFAAGPFQKRRRTNR